MVGTPRAQRDVMTDVQMGDRKINKEIPNAQNQPTPEMKKELIMHQQFAADRRGDLRPKYEDTGGFDSPNSRGPQNDLIAHNISAKAGF